MTCKKLIKPGHLVKHYNLSNNLKENKLLYEPFLVDYASALTKDADSKILSQLNSINSRSILSIQLQELSPADEQLLLADFNLIKGEKHFNKNVFIKWLGKKWGRAFYLYSLNLTGTELYLLKYISYHAYIYSLTEALFIEYLKLVGQNALKLAANGDLKFLYFINLEVLGGYDTVNNRVNVLKEQFHKVNKIPTTAYTLTNELTTEIKKIIGKIVIKNEKNHQTFAEFIAYRDNWSIGSSCSDGKPLEILDARTGQVINSLKGKMFKLTCFSNDEIQNNCKARKICKISTFIKKDEPAKARNIQNFDVYSFLRCSYFESFIKSYSIEANSFNCWTSIGLTTEKLSVLINNYAKLLRTGDCIAISIDQSEFDMHQPIEAIKFVVSELVQHILRHTSVKYEDILRELLQYELYALDHMFVINVEKGVKYKWVHGLPSGYKFTALIGSVLNAAINNMVLKRLQLSVRASVYQGDDALIIINKTLKYSESSLLNELAATYETLGLVLNRNKSLISRTSFEYLKHFYIQGRVFGIPARAFKSIVWKKPKTEIVFESTATKFQNRLATLRMCARRLCNYIPKKLYAIIKYMLLRIDKKKTLNRADILSLIHTPVYMGGLGFGNWGNTGIKITRNINDSAYMRIIINEQTLHPSLRVKEFISMLRRRTLEYVPIKGITYAYELYRTPSRKQLKKFFFSKYQLLNCNEYPLEINWPSDKYKGKLAYQHKLELEYNLELNLPIPKKLVTDHRLKKLKSDKDRLKVIKAYTSLADSLLSVENSRLNILTYAPHLQNIYSLWTSTLAHILVTNNKKLLHYLYIYFQSLIYTVLKDRITPHTALYFHY